MYRANVHCLLKNLLCTCGRAKKLAYTKTDGIKPKRRLSLYSCYYIAPSKAWQL